MMDYTQLQDVFPAGVQNPYDKKLQHDIDAHRKTYDGHLFIDKVVKALGISKGWTPEPKPNDCGVANCVAKAYPPKTDNAVRQFHQQVCESSMSLHHKFSLLYYVLLDFDLANPRQSVSESFVSASGMPKEYQIFMKGLWYMDQFDFQSALEFVSHPSLTPDFADDILIALVRHAPDEDYSLALAYYTSVQPILKSSVALELLFHAMAHTNVTEALLFSRTHPEHTREQLFRQLVSVVLEGGRGGSASARASELAFMPFDATEEAWFEDYLTSGDGKTLKKAKDTLLIRKIACDQFGEISKARPSGPWAPILGGIRAGIEGHSE